VGSFKNPSINPKNESKIYLKENIAEGFLNDAHLKNWRKVEDVDYTYLQ
jgi:hypothetical protein